MSPRPAGHDDARDSEEKEERRGEAAEERQRNDRREAAPREYGQPVRDEHARRRTDGDRGPGPIPRAQGSGGELGLVPDLREEEDHHRGDERPPSGPLARRLRAIREERPHAEGDE